MSAFAFVHHGSTPCDHLAAKKAASKAPPPQGDQARVFLQSPWQWPPDEVTWHILRIYWIYFYNDVCIHTYVYIYIYTIYIYIIHLYTSPVPGAPHPPNGMAPPTLHLPNLPFARYLQHLEGTASHLYAIYSIWETSFRLHAICSIWEPQPRHWTLSSCRCLTYQSSTYYPKHVYVLPIAYLTHGLQLIVCLYATLLHSCYL